MKKKKTQEEKPSNTELELQKTLEGRRFLERQKIAPKKKEFNRAIDTLIEAIHDRLAESAFFFESGCHSLEQDVMSSLHEVLDPTIPFDEKFIEAAFDKLLDGNDTSACHDALSALQAALRQTYFNAGVLMGAALKGTSREDLKRMGTRWR